MEDRRRTSSKSNGLTKSWFLSTSLLVFSCICINADPEISQGTLITKPHLRSWDTTMLKEALTMSPYVLSQAIQSSSQSPLRSFANNKMIKRSPSNFAPSRAYSFGLGKKSLTPSMDFSSQSLTYDTPINYPSSLTSHQQSQQQDDLPSSSMDDVSDSAAVNQRLNSPYRIQSPGSRVSGRVRFARRPNLYSFGLGKRGWLGSLSLPSPVYLGDIKRRYSFGLGKRSADEE